MIRLFNKSNEQLMGEITEDQLRFLVDQMEEESTEDQDYSITAMELEYFRTHGADPGLIDMLQEALGEAEELIIVWRRS
jgi:processive 1,2-diacylglycerol beta-glucosyltransferase